MKRILTLFAAAALLAGVGEAAKTISDLQTARLAEADIVVGAGAGPIYRVKLEMAFQLDRSRSAIYMPNTRSFPENTEVESTLTFTSRNPGGLVNGVAATGQAAHPGYSRTSSTPPPDRS